MRGTTSGRQHLRCVEDRVKAGAAACRRSCGAIVVEDPVERLVRDVVSCRQYEVGANRVSASLAVPSFRLLPVRKGHVPSSENVRAGALSSGHSRAARP